MERLKRWLNKTGKFRFDGRKIGPGEEFDAYPSQVPACFRDTIELINENVEPEKKAPEKVEETEKSPVPPEIEEHYREQAEEADQRFVVKHRSAGWYNIFDQESGELANAKAMRKEEAEELAEELNDANS